MEKIKLKILEIKQSKKGSLNLPMSAYLLFIITSLATLIDVSSMRFATRELQNKIDVAGTNALYSVVNLNYLREETMAITSNNRATSANNKTTWGSSTVYSSGLTAIVEKAFNNEVDKLSLPGKVDGTKAVVRQCKVYLSNDNFGLGYLTTSVSKARPQIILETVVSYEMSTSSATDSTTRRLTTNIKSVKSNSNVNITVTDTGNDGRKSVVIYSMTRVVLK